MSAEIIGRRPITLSEYRGVDSNVLLEREEVYLGQLSDRERPNGSAVLGGGSGEQGVGNGSSSDDGGLEQ